MRNRKEDRKGKEEKEEKPTVAKEGTVIKKRKLHGEDEAKLSQYNKLAQVSWLLICFSRPICGQENIGSVTASFYDLGQAV